MHNSFYSDDYYDDHDALCHYGVKGMHWGIRRTPEQLGHRPLSKQAGYNKRVRDAKKLEDIPVKDGSGKHPIGYNEAAMDKINYFLDKKEYENAKPVVRKASAMSGTMAVAAGSAWMGGNATAELAAGAKVTANIDPEFSAGLATASAVAGGVTAAVAIPNAAASYLLYQSLKRNVGKRGLDLDDTDRQEWYDEKHPYEDLKTVRKLSKPDTVDEAVTAVNPKDAYESAYKSTLRRHNCANCAIATTMRMKGYDVVARGNFDGVVTRHIDEVFGKKAVKFVSTKQDAGESKRAYLQRGYDNFHDALAKQPKGAYGVVALSWLNGGGHAFNYVIGDNGPEFYDGQCQLKPPHTRAYFAVANPESYSYVRADNIEPTAISTHYVVSREGGDKKR